MSQNAEDLDLEGEEEVENEGQSAQSEDPAALKAELAKLQRSNRSLLSEVKATRKREREDLLAAHPGLTEELIGDLDIRKVKTLLDALKPSEEATDKPSTEAVDEAKNFLKGGGQGVGAAKEEFTAKELYDKVKHKEITEAEMRQIIQEGRMKKH